MSDIFNMADTWNAGGTTFTAILMNVTDTASDAASLLMDLKRDGTSVFAFGKTGSLSLGDSTAASVSLASRLSGANDPALIFSNGSFEFRGDGIAAATRQKIDASNVNMGSAVTLGWASGSTATGAADTLLTRESAGFMGSPGSLRLMNATAIPAGGTAGAGYKFSSTANFGVFFGSGAPTLAAAKGSLYLRSDGSGVADRAYINTDGSTAWTSLTTVT